MNDNLAYQEEQRVELIGGKVVMMAPASTNHTFVCSNIFWIFESHLRKKRKCTPIGDGTTIYLTDKDHFVPDFMIVCDPDKIRPDGVHGAPDLVVEVLSPSTARNDKTRKKDAYARCGVREYWIVSPGEKFVEVYRANGTKFVLHDIYALRPSWELAKMSKDDRADLVTHFKCSLFDDLDISLEDIFYRTF